MQASLKKVSATAVNPTAVHRNRTINAVNIGLILASFTIALYLPFQLFLFAYAVLGPAHYLTEISWLQKRNFFTSGNYDPWVLAGLAALISATAVFPFGATRQVGTGQIPAVIIAFAFGATFVFHVTGRVSLRIFGLLLVALVTTVSLNSSAFLVLLFAMFIPTLIHVYVFTGIFILFGALKDRSLSGYISFFIFVLCPLIYLFIHPTSLAPSNHIVQSYWRPFSGMNTALLGLSAPHSQAEMDYNVRRVFGSQAGIVAMRFIAFAYTYHYLNWFSKTGIIKWHRVSGQRLAIICLMWASCVLLYFYNESLAIRVLFCLSFLHVFLEFPLNQIAIAGVFRQFWDVRKIRWASNS